MGIAVFQRFVRSDLTRVEGCGLGVVQNGYVDPMEYTSGSARRRWKFGGRTILKIHREGYYWISNMAELVILVVLD
jgi:hypothetical protein